MAKKQRYSYKARRSDMLTTRMMIVFALLLVSVFALLTAKNWLDTMEAIDKYDTYVKTIRFLPIIPIILTIASGVFVFMARKNKRDESLKVFSSTFLFTVSAVFLAVSLMISKYVYSGYVPAIVLIILVSLLYFIAISFPGPYVVLTVFNALGAFAIYALNLVSPITNPIMNYSLRVLVIIAAVLFVLALLEARKNNGEVLGFKLLAPDASYLPIFIAVGVFALLIILGAFGIGSYVIFDVIIGLETIIFALFYAIKMLK